MPKKLDDYAIRLISHHGKLLEQYARTMNSLHKESIVLALKATELDLKADYGLRLPYGVRIED